MGILSTIFSSDVNNQDTFVDINTYEYQILLKKRIITIDYFIEKQKEYLLPDEFFENLAMLCKYNMHTILDNLSLKLVYPEKIIFVFTKMCILKDINIQTLFTDQLYINKYHKYFEDFYYLLQMNNYQLFASMLDVINSQKMYFSEFFLLRLDINYIPDSIEQNFKRAKPLTDHSSQFYF